MMDVRSLAACISAYQDEVDAYYDALQSLGAPDGLFFDASTDAWVVTSYDLCAELLRLPQLGRQRIALPKDRNSDLVDCAEAILNSQLMFADSPEGATRSYWGTKLTEAVAEDGSDTLQRLAIQCIEDGGQATVELYADVLQPFASRVASASIGLDETNRQRLYPLIAQCVRFLDGKICSDRDFDGSMFAIVSLYDRLSGLFREESLRVHAGGNWIANLMLALVAGHESTAYLLGTVFLEVQHWSPQLDVARVVRESLRFDSPVQLIGRRVVSSIEVAGETIPAGAKLYFHVGAANRDPKVFPAPNRFEVGRRGRPPLAFGVGEGQCLGRSVALRSANAFLGLLIARGEWFEIQGTVERASGLSGRGFRRLSALRVHDSNTTKSGMSHSS